MLLIASDIDAWWNTTLSNASLVKLESIPRMNVFMKKVFIISTIYGRLLIMAPKELHVKAEILGLKIG